VVVGRGGNRRPLYLLKLDSSPIRRHTHRTMTRPARALELPSLLQLQLGALGLVILTVIVILPR